MNPRLLGLCVLLMVSLVGCGPPNEEEDPPEPAVIEVCTNDHDQLWIEATDGTAIAIADGLGEPVRADQSCNRIQWHGASGFQGGSTFHIEPVIIRSGPPVDYAILFKLEVPGGETTESGVEVFPQEWTVHSDTLISYRTQLFIGESTRGKNAILTATVQEIGSSAEDIRAGLHISEENENF